jgi:divalent metal cation (Fe/Co/Zn/Cd) transporter
MRRAARGSGSLIMKGQLQARVVKLVSSACVQLSLTVAALSWDGVVITWADSLGALFVCAFIVHAAIGMIRSDLPDLIDRAVNEDIQAAIQPDAGPALRRLRSARPRAHPSLGQRRPRGNHASGSPRISPWWTSAGASTR